MTLCEVTAPEMVVKQPSEVRQYVMDFSNPLESSESILGISSVTHTLRGGGVSDLTVYNESVSGQTVIIWVSGGTDRNTYRIEIIVTTDANQTLEGDGLLSVRDN